MARLITDWSTDDPLLGEMLKSIAEEKDDVLRLELEAGLHTWQAQHCIKTAARLELYREGYVRRKKRPSPLP